MVNETKIHIALNVNSLDESVSFYRAMFGIDPIKLKPGYAKFDVADPALNLTLNYIGPVRELGALNHLGVQVSSTNAVIAARERLQAAGLGTFDEMNTDCCYALQDKIWVTDPNGYRWEVFVVKIADTSSELTPITSETAKPAPLQSCCTGTTCTAQ